MMLIQLRKLGIQTTKAPGKREAGNPVLLISNKPAKLEQGVVLRFQRALEG